MLPHIGFEDWEGEEIGDMCRVVVGELLGIVGKVMDFVLECEGEWFVWVFMVSEGERLKVVGLAVQIFDAMFLNVELYHLLLIGMYLLDGFLFWFLF